MSLTTAPQENEARQRQELAALLVKKKSAIDLTQTQILNMDIDDVNNDNGIGLIIAYM